MNDSFPRLGVWGTGPVGVAVAGLHVASGGRVAGMVSRDPARARRRGGDGEGLEVVAGAEELDCDVLLVCVPDDSLTEVAAKLATGVSGDAWVFHTSGAHSGDVLGDSDRYGSLHPLQSFPRHLTTGRDRSLLIERARAAHWFHEGHGVDVARRLVRGWGCAFHALDRGRKALYHAAAATVSNHVVALTASASEMLRAAGLDVEASMAAFHQLLVGTAGNVEKVGVPAALTGPVERGDVATVAAHVDALRRHTRPETLALYRIAGLRTVEVALEKGSIDREVADALRLALSRTDAD